MSSSVCFLGFGEAAQSFCGDDRWQGVTYGYDIKLNQPNHSSAKIKDFEEHNVGPKINIELIPDCSDTTLSVVTADQTQKAAESAAPYLRKGALYIDMNSAAPQTKQAAAKVMTDHGVDYVDVAIMAPVNPKQLDVPLLLAGPNADDAKEKLLSLGFQKVRIVGNEVGQASSIKMLRSVLIKGIEALSAECVIAASRAGVVDEVFGSMGPEWLEKADYNLDRMMVHGIRRAAEIEEVVKTLEGLGVDPTMSRGTVKRQRDIGSMGLNPPPDNLAEKLDALNKFYSEATH